MSTQKSERKLWHAFEEGLLVLILALMTALTFINVILRSWFGSSILWGLEATSYLFAWLVILGLGYLVRTHSHLGVDAVINLFEKPVRRTLGLIVAVICIFYALLLLKGAYDFSANFFNLPQTVGPYADVKEPTTWQSFANRVIPIGFQEMKIRDYQGLTSVFDIPMPNWLRPIWEPVFLLEGDPPYRKLPINIPYMALFLGALWMLIRFCIALVEIKNGVTDRLIASHEVEDAIDDVREQLGKEA